MRVTDCWPSGKPRTAWHYVGCRWTVWHCDAPTQRTNRSDIGQFCHTEVTEARQEMARTLKEFEFPARVETAYPWTEWMDGRIYEAKQGEDYTCADRSFQAQLNKKAAATKGMHCRSRVVSGTVTFQFYR